MRRKSATTVEELADRLDLEPEHVPVLRLALTHRSQGNGAATDNERLEFLGDSILGMLANEYLYEQFPEASEGQLTRMKANIVSEASLARPARALGLGQMLDIARGEEAAGGRDRSSTLADTFEAVLAALYLCAGLDAARRFVREYLVPDVDLTRAWDYKSTLQELLQERYRRSPAYRILHETGPAHAREFVAEVYLGEMLLGAGRGGSKKQAEQVAAAEALALLEQKLKKPRRSRKSAEKAGGAAAASPTPADAPAGTAAGSASGESVPAVEAPPPAARRGRMRAAGEPVGSPPSASGGVAPPGGDADPMVSATGAEAAGGAKKPRAKRTKLLPLKGEASDASAEPPVAEPQPGPRAQRSHRKAAAAEPADPASAATGEAVPSETGTAAKAVTRRGTGKKAVTGGAPQVVEEAAPGRRARRKPPGEQATPSDDPPAAGLPEAAPAQRKPRTRPRKTKADEAANP